MVPKDANKPAPAQPVPAAPASSGGRLVVVFGTKGGVGKTVVAANVAVSLAQQLRHPVCLVDLDMAAVGDLARMLNVAPRQSLVDLATALKRPTLRQADLLKAVVVNHSSGVEVVAGLSNPNQTKQLDAASLPQIFRLLKERYPYVVVDAGKVFSDALIACLDEANLILLVATPDIVTLYQTKWAVDTIESLLLPSSMIKIVLNRADSRGGVESEDVKVALPCEIIAEIPSDGKSVGTAVNQGVPVVTAYGSTRVAEAYRRLAEVLIQRTEIFITHQAIPRYDKNGAANGGAPGSARGDANGPAMSSARLYQNQQAGGADEPVDDIVALKQRIHERLVEELDLKRLDLATLAHQSQLTELRQRTERVIGNLLAREMAGLLSNEVRLRLVKEIADEALGLGPLEELLADASISDILVNNKDEIYIERNGKLQLTLKKFMSNDQVRTVIERIVAPLGRRVDEANPMVDARLPDGSRVNAIIPPLSVRGPVLSIRKFGRERHGLPDLIRIQSLDEPMAQLLKACVVLRKNMIISGGTGSGKTTMLNVLSSFIPDDDRIITIEDAVELRLSQRHWLSLEGRPANVEGRGQISTRDLFRNALRMRPDRIIIGECRGEETLDMLQAMNTGHEGSMTTVHANSPRDVISRIDSMVLMSSVELPLRAIHEMVASAIHVLVHTARLADGSRKITAISEVLGLSGESDVRVQELYAFHQTGVGPKGEVLGQFAPTGARPTFFEESKRRGVELPASLFEPRDPSPTGRP